MSEGRRDREQFVPENEALRHRVAALQAEAKRFKEALYSIGDAVISAAGDGNALTRMVLRAIEDINEHTQAVETCKRGDYLHSVGSDRMVPSSSATIFHPDDNASVATVAQGRDITEQSRVEEVLHASREQLRALSARLLVVREEERISIARDIHDLLAQDLTRLKIDLVWLQGRLVKNGTITVPGTLAARVTEMVQTADAAIQCVQRIATELRPAMLDSLGLCAAVEWQARDVQDHSGIQCRVSVPEGELPVDRDSATAAFRILQESLNNVQRHAKATRVDVLLRQEAGLLLLRVHDNGSGIEPAALKSPMSIGLTGMRERALLLGGQLDIRGLPGEGTTVEIRLPLKKTEKAQAEQL